MRPAWIVAIAIGVCEGKEESEPSEAAPVEAPAEEKEAKEEEAKAPKPVPVGDLELVGFDAALDRAIERLDDDRIRVDPFVATLVAEQLSATGGEPDFRRVPRKQIKAGAPNGFRVGKLERGSLFHRLGLRSGDVVTKVGSAAPPLPKKMRELLETIEYEVDVELTRDGNVVKIRYEIAGEQSWRDYLAKTAGRKFDEDAEEEEPEQQAAAGGSKPSTGGGGGGGSSSSGTPSGGKPTGGGGSSSTTPENIPVSCSSSSSCTVAKWYFDKVVSSSSQMRSQAKISPASGGYKLAWVKPGSGVHKLLFRTGDVITRVNGRNLSNQLEALSLYAGLKSTRTYKVNYTRGGKSLTKTIRIV